MDSEGAAGEANLSFRVIMEDERPSELLAQAVAIVDSTPEPDTELIDCVGAGALETLVRNHGVELWGEIERLARANIRFRRALRSVWAYDSPEFEPRSRLLKELGEWWTVELRFVVEPQDLSGGTHLGWRARQVSGAIAPNELVRILREIADNVEREQLDRQQPQRREGPFDTVEELVEDLIAEYAAEETAIVMAPHRDDMCLVLLSLPRERTVQSIVTADPSWALRTLRPVDNWLPYHEGPQSSLGVFTEHAVDGDTSWRPTASTGASCTALGAETYVSFWGVERADGMERCRVLRQPAT